MFGLGRLKQARETMLRQFSGQFDTYNDFLVYRPLSKGQPIRVSEQERTRFIEAFDRFARRSLWIGMAATLGLIGLIVGLDESATLPLPDWVPMVAVIALLPLFAFIFRRAMTAPLSELTGRAPMGGERSREDLAKVQLRQLGWHALIVPLVLGAAFVALALFAKPEFRAAHPFVYGAIILFGGYMLIGGAVALYRKWQAER